MQNHLEGSIGIAVQGKNVTLHNHPRGADLPDPVSAAADRLAENVQAQWEDEANVRGLTGPGRLAVQWNTRGLPSAAPATAQPERLGLDDLILRMRALRPTRLVITGDGGAGKSSMAVLLAIAMLKDRAPGDAVPVILSLSDWDPGELSLQDWVIERVSEDYGDLTTGPEPGVVKSLVQRRKIIPVLDGLDELMPLPHAVTATALRRSCADDDAPLVLLSRPEAYAAAAAKESFLRTMPLLRACPVAPEAGRDYLTRECDPKHVAAWEPVFQEMVDNPDGSVATALSSPLMLWLAATVHASDGTEPRDLIDSTRLPAREHIEAHLLDGLVPAVFSQGLAPSYVPGPVRPWGSDRALRYLRFLADQLNRRRTQDIAWWHIRTTLTRPVVWSTVVLIAAALCGTGVSYAVAALLSLARQSPTQPAFRPTAEALSAVAGLSTLVTVFGQLFTRHLFPGMDDRPRRPVRVPRGRLPALPAVAMLLAGAGLLTPGTLPAVLIAFFLPGLLGVLLTRRAEADTAIKPRLLLDDQRRIALTDAVVVAPAVAGVSMALFRQLDRHPLVAVAGLVIAWSCSALVLLSLSRWGRWTATRLALACRRCLPRDVLSFLEDAHRLGVLRQVGGVYQFRHAGLRQRLTGSGPAPAPSAARTPREIRLRSSFTSLRTLGLLSLDLVMPIVTYLVVVSPLSSGTGYRADWHQSWELLVRDRLLFAALAAVLLLTALALRAVATELRIDCETVELDQGRKLRLRWDDVADVRVRTAEPPRALSAVLPAQYHLAVKPKHSDGVPKSRTDSHGWVRIWDLGPTGVVPLELEFALSHFAGDRWDIRP
ncbi:hypothetical protein ACFZB9_25015 [Kitasatospora sp. NPDC008050]|uniref:hypothetical protein n=1 Tax=Kitasatospora sp. NPDC008050 TaxID=3364021 RepID=UPI0036EB879A